ncbi:hypothetical protein ACP4OV_024009 [Aristida adscensionis]
MKLSNFQAVFGRTRGNWAVKPTTVLGSLAQSRKTLRPARETGGYLHP